MRRAASITSWAYLGCQALGWSLYAALIAVAMFSTAAISPARAMAAVGCKFVIMSGLFSSAELARVPYNKRSRSVVLATPTRRARRSVPR